MHQQTSDPPAAGDQQRRRREQRGWYFYDWANSAFYTTLISVFGAAYVGGIAATDARRDPANGPVPCGGHGASENHLVHCDISAFGLHFPAGSLWGFLVSLATIVQVIVLPVTGAIADRSPHKLRILGILAFVGSASTALMVVVTGTDWPFFVLLYLVGQVCYGASIVVYYSFLNDIAGPDERDDVSARGWAFGYLGGGLCLVIQLALFVGHDHLGLGEGAAVRICFLLAGVWWAAFTVIPLRTLPSKARTHEVSSGGGSVLRAGFSELAQTFRGARAFPLTLWFLGAYLVFNDGISTVVSVASQYGREELHFPQQTMIVTILVIQFVAFFGGRLHGILAGRFGAKRTVLGSLCVWIVVITGAYFVQAGDEIAFYAVAVGIGLVLGGTVALTRSLFSQLIPPGKEGQYFSLYEISERGTAWIGPLLFAGIGAATGSFRPAIIALSVFFVVGFLLLIFLPVRRGIRAAGNPEPELV